MSSPSPSYFFAKDILDECDMKPWWERARAFLFFLTTTVQFFFVYDIKKPTAVDCTPRSSSIALTAMEKSHANSLCFFQIPLSMSDFKFANLATVVMTFGIYNIWFAIPRVRRTFQTLRKCDDAIKELSFTPRELKEVVRHLCQQSNAKIKSRQVKDKPKMRKVSAVCRDLWNSNTEFPLSVSEIYILRSILSSVPIILSIYILRLYRILGDPNELLFDCQLKRERTTFSRSFHLTCFQNLHVQVTTVQFFGVLQRLLIGCNVIMLVLQVKARIRFGFGRKYLWGFGLSFERVLHGIAHIILSIAMLLTFVNDVSCDAQPIELCFSLAGFVFTQAWLFILHGALIEKHRMEKEKENESETSNVKWLAWGCMNLTIAAWILIKSSEIYSETLCPDGLIPGCVGILFRIYNVLNFFQIYQIRTTFVLPTVNYDNEFASRFADAASPLCDGTKALLRPASVLDSGFDIDQIMQELQSTDSTD